jgi:hypothetical protein
MSKKPPEWALGPHTDLLPGIEVRLNEDGTVDEIVTSRPCTFHLEQMDDGQYWIGLTPTTGNRKRDYQSIMLTRSGKFIYPTVYR